MRKLLVLLLLISSFAWANVGKIVSLSGEATILRDAKELKVTKNTILEKNDILNTKKQSKLQILFKDETIISVGQNSILKINDYLFEEQDVKAEFGMVKGVFRTITGKIGKIAPENFKLKTKTATIGIRGTQILTSISDGVEKIFCTEGQISIQNNLTNEIVIVSQGQFISMPEGSRGKMNVKKTKQSDINSTNKEASVQQNVAQDAISQDETPAQPQTTKEIEITDSTGQKIVLTTKTEKKPVVEETDTKDDSNNSTGNNGNNPSNIPNNISRNFYELTPYDFFINNQSKATYQGNFNNYPSTINGYNMHLERQKLVREGKPYYIPKNTTISMDIDFGKASKQITNGLVNVKDANIKFTFDGEINQDDSSFSLEGTNNTNGDGEGNFYGPQAQEINGYVNLEKDDENKIQGRFDAVKK